MERVWKRVFAFLLIMAWVVDFVPQDVKASSDSDYVIEDGVLVEYTGTDSVVTVPDGVTEIGHSAFLNKEFITSITLPDSLIVLGDSAVQGCKNLTDINLPEGLLSIGSSEFVFCESLTSITLPDSLASIGDGAFRSSGITDIKVSSANKAYKIVDECLYNSENQLIYCPGGIVKGDFVLWDNTVSVGNYAFWWCEGLNDVTFPSGLTSIGDWAFSRCTGLTSITLPEGLTSIGYSAFWKCSGLTSITLPESLTSIGAQAFAHCSAVTNLKIPRGIIEIKVSTFMNCTALTKIDIPREVTSIDETAFEGTSDSLVIRAFSDSVAAKYAKENGITLEELDTVICKVLFADGSSVVKQETVVYGGSATAPELKKEGYELSWDTTFDYVTGDMRVNAVWTKKKPESTPKPIPQPTAPPADNNSSNTDSEGVNPVQKSGENNNITSRENTSTNVSVKEPVLKKGSTFSAGGIQYKVKSISGKKGTLIVQGVTSRKCKKITVPKKVKKSGVIFKIVEVKSKAFSGCKELKKLTIKSKDIKKAGKKILKGASRKKVKIVVPKSKVKFWRKVLK